MKDIVGFYHFECPVCSRIARFAPEDRLGEKVNTKRVEGCLSSMFRHVPDEELLIGDDTTSQRGCSLGLLKNDNSGAVAPMHDTKLLP